MWQGIEAYRAALPAEEQDKCKISIRYIPYFLNPAIVVPETGMPFSEYMRRAGQEGDIHNDTNADESAATIRALGASCEPALLF